MLHGLECFPSAQRFLLRIRHKLIVDPPTAATKDIWALIDLEPVAGGHIEGTTEPNVDGLVLRVSIQSLESLPDLLVPGVRIEIELSLEDNGSVIYWENWATFPGSSRWSPNSENWVGGGDTQGWIIDPLWTFGNFVQKYQSGNECYAFPRQSSENGGFAEFNGVDSYIELDHNVNAFSLPFRVTYEMRWKVVQNWKPMFGNFEAGGFFGMKQERSVFGGLSIPTTWVPVTDHWVSYRYDFEQTGQLAHQLYIDDIVRMDAIASRQFMSANRLGVYRHGLLGELWAAMDVRNLKYLTGTVGDFTTVLDMPLIENALDLGPQANHGTTFNMDLPSV